MPIKALLKDSEWVSLNIVNGIYLIKDWLLLNVGINVLEIQTGGVELVLEWGIGLSIFAFNIVRIFKYIKDLREPKED